MVRSVITNEKKVNFLLKISICFVFLLTLLLLDNGTILGDSYTALATDETDAQFMYLSDIPYATGSSAGYGSIYRNRTESGGQFSVRIEGGFYSFQKGIWAHASSTVIYNITNYQGYDYFTTYMGVNETSGNVGNGVKFSVYTSEDGRTWNLKTEENPTAIKSGNDAIFVKIPLENAKFIKLEANDNGANGNDHSVYVDPKLIKATYKEPGTDLVPTVEKLDEEIKTKYANADLTNEEYKLTLLKRELISRVGPYGLRRFYLANDANKETYEWLTGDVKVLECFILGGQPEGGYYSALTQLTRLYEAYKDDFKITDTTKYGTVLGDLYTRMAIAMALTHSQNVGLWIQSGGENSSDAVRRYKIYKDMHKNGNFVILRNEDGTPKLNANGTPQLDVTQWFENYNVEEMRYIFNNLSDDEETLWLNEYTQSFVDQHQSDYSRYISPHPYMDYRDENLNQPEFYDPDRKDEWDAHFKGIFSKYKVTYRPGLKKIWMFLRNPIVTTGAVCGGISKIGSSVRTSHGIPCVVIGQPGHAAMIYYWQNADGKGYWNLDNNVSGWTASERGERLLLGWGNAGSKYISKDATFQVVYTMLAQEALNDYDNLVKAEETIYLAKVYKGDLAKQEQLYERALEIQPINLDAWLGLIDVYNAEGSTKEEEDYYRLAQRIAEKLKCFPLPMYHLTNLIKPKLTSVGKSYQFTLLQTRTLTEGSTLPDSATDQVLQPSITRTEANFLLGKIDKTIATFSFDGADAGKIVLSSRFNGSGVRWDYCLDGNPVDKTHFREISFSAEQEHKLQLTPEELASITAEKDIYIHIVGVGYETENLYKIDIQNPAGLPATLYANDLENKLIAAPPTLQWKLNANDGWTYMRDREPDLTGNKTVTVKMGATGLYLGMNDSDAVSYKFTEENQPDTRKYISVSHLSLHSVSSQATSQGLLATNAIDANLNTKWHSAWDGSDRKKEYVIKLDEAKYISSLEFYSVEGGNGKIESLGISISMDGENWTEIVSETNWTYANANDVSVKSVDFNPAKALYVKLVGKRTQAASADNSFIAAKMFNLFEDTTVLATFSFDGENANKIVLDEKYNVSNWTYSIDGGTTWKNGNGDSYTVPDSDINAITEENGIKLRVNVNGEIKESVINIGKGTTPALGYANDLENRVIGLTDTNILEWKYSDGNTWTAYETQEPVVTGNKTLQIRKRATRNYLPSDVVTYEFTEDTDTETSKYISIKHLSIASFSTESVRPDRNQYEYARNAIDGNINTMWHTNREITNDERFIVIKLDKPRYITKLQYVKKAGYLWGVLKNGVISTSMDGETWQEAVTITDLYNPTNEEELRAAENSKDIPFPEAKYAQYINIQCTKACDYINRNDTDYFLSAAMLNLFEDTTKIKPTGKLGDTDGNGKITTKDAKMVLQHIVKKITLTPEQIINADTDKNGRITTKDAKMILQHIVKKIDLSTM